VLSVRRVGVDTLEMNLAGTGAEGNVFDGAALLSALVRAGVAVADFRQDDGSLEELFLELTSTQAGTAPEGR
jgi:hypothetical protein